MTSCPSTGLSANFSKDEIQGITRQLIDGGLLAKAEGEYPTLAVTMPQGGSFSEAERPCVSPGRRNAR